jgi:hypothetical protein
MLRLQRVSEWPLIEEPELLDRLGMDDRRFEEFIQGLAAAMPVRTFEPEVLELAIGYPWERPAGSYLLTGEVVELLEEMTATERDEVIERFALGASGRLPVLAIGSNGGPRRLRDKFAHFPDEDDRVVLALTGRLHDFDIGVAAQPALYGSMPATLFPSPGTEVCATVLWVTQAQFTQLTWSELSYRLGRLRTRFELDEGGEAFDEVMVFVSRFGAFCVEDSPVALAAIPAAGRTAAALTQEQLLDTAAALALGPGARADALVRAIYEEAAGIGERLAAVRRASMPFASDRWTPFQPGR